VNVAGAFALGLTLRLLQASVAGPETRAFLAVGFLGAFTTFSTFSWEAIALIQDGEWARASLYLGGSVVAGLAAVLAGIWLAGAFLQARG
jgi:CrcB protein